MSCLRVASLVARRQHAPAAATFAFTASVVQWHASATSAAGWQDKLHWSQMCSAVWYRAPFLHRAFVGLALSVLLQPLGHAIDKLCAPSGDYHALAMSSGPLGKSIGPQRHVDR